MASLSRSRITREEADRIIAENCADCFVEIYAEDLAALARGDSLLFVIEEEHTLELSLAVAAPPKDEEYKRYDERAWQKQQRLKGIVIEDGSYRDGRVPTPHSSASPLVGIVRKKGSGSVADQRLK